MTKYRQNISHEKFVHEFLESLKDEKTRDVAGKVIHDEWHEAHSKGWYDAKLVYGYELRRLLKDRYIFPSLNKKDRRALLKAIKEALE